MITAPAIVASPTIAAPILWLVVQKPGSFAVVDWLSGEAVRVAFPDACALMTVTCDRLPLTATCTA